MALEPGDIDEIGKAFGSWKDAIPTASNLTENISRLYDEINKVNKTFTEGRLRATEFSTAVSDSVAGVIRVGGEVTDIGNTINAIAAGSRRNIVATTETIVELTAASKALGDFDIETITNNFAQAGVEISQVGKNLQDSILYVQSIGLNATTIVQEMTRNMDMMNRFNFEDGVIGLTKMTAQASMLRYDMRETAKFAEDVLNPDGAIKMASAFQRLGVAAGDLVDPFVLMDKSINDPQGLQDSIIEMTKQFTYFDDKTNSFKINPGSIRLMKELATETNISFENMTKTALAASDMDRRLNEIDFNIQASEEDKMLVANMAKMGPGGEYFVELQNERGTLEQKKLTDLTQNEFERLREIQETRPKTMEDIARAQLGTFDMMARDVKALPLQLAYALAGQEGIIRLGEASRRLFDTAVGGAYTEGALPSGQEMRKVFEGVGDELRTLVVEASKGNTEALEQSYQRLRSGIENTEVANRVQTYLDNLNFEGGPRSTEESYMDAALKKFQDLGGKAVDGMRTTTENRNVNFGGSFTIRVEGQQGLDTKALSDYINSESFKQKMTLVVQEEMKKQNTSLRK
jgi:hypothetical protein